MWRFRKRWEGSGLCSISGDEQKVKLIMFMRERTRDRWRDRNVDMQARRFRAQQHSPPLDTASVSAKEGSRPHTDSRFSDVGGPRPLASFDLTFSGSVLVYVKCDI